MNRFILCIYNNISGFSCVWSILFSIQTNFKLLLRLCKSVCKQSITESRFSLRMYMYVQLITNIFDGVFVNLLSTKNFLFASFSNSWSTTSYLLAPELYSLVRLVDFVLPFVLCFCDVCLHSFDKWIQIGVTLTYCIRLVARPILLLWQNYKQLSYKWVVSQQQ